MKMPTNICYKCNEPIDDRIVVLINDNMCHEDCSRCSRCNCLLVDQCFELNNAFFCAEDYWSEKFEKCARCEGPIFPNEMILRSLPHRVFHENCFLCSICDKRLLPGDRYYVFSSGSVLVCQFDHDNMKKDVNQRLYGHLKNNHRSDGSSDDSGNLESGHSFQRSTENLKSHPPSVCFDEDLNSDIEQSYDDVMSSDNDKSCGIRKRTPRTTIKATQLESLKSTFAITPKPSRQMREQLAECTGLSMRVIQVWFQNRRSKERRSKVNGQRKIDRYRFTTHSDMDHQEGLNNAVIRHDTEPQDSNLQMHLNSGSFNSRNFSKVTNESISDSRFSSSWFVNRSLGLFNKIV